MNSKLSRLGWLVLLLLGIVTLTPFLQISMYNRPVGDDFTYANEGSNGLGIAQEKLYNRISARYSATFLYTLPGHSVPLAEVAQFLPMVTFGVIFILIWLLISKTVSFQSLELVVISLLMTVVYLSNIPGVRGDTLFWIGGIINYQFSVLSLWLLALCWLVFGKKVKLIAIPILVVAISGLQELTAFNILLISLMVITWQIYSRVRISVSLVLQIFVALASAIVMLVAPGSKARIVAENIGYHRTLDQIILASIQETVSWASRWLLHPSVFLALLALIVFAICFRPKLKVVLPSWRWWLLAAFATLFLNILVMNFLTGQIYDRSMLIPYALFLTLLVGAIINIKSLHFNRFGESRLAMMIIIALALFASTQTVVYQNINNDLNTGRASYYYRYFSSLDHTLSGCIGTPKCTVKLFIDRELPKSLLWYGDTFSNAYFRRERSLYYGFKGELIINGFLSPENLEQ